MVLNDQIWGVKKQTQLNMTKITVAKGDGIGPEIMEATLEIILEACAEVEMEEIKVGEKVKQRWEHGNLQKRSSPILEKNPHF